MTDEYIMYKALFTAETGQRGESGTAGMGRCTARSLNYTCCEYLIIFCVHVTVYNFLFPRALFLFGYVILLYVNFG